MHEVLLNNLQDVAEEVLVLCSARGSGSDCSATHLLQKMGSVAPLHLLQDTLLFISFILSLSQFLCQTEESSHSSSSTSQISKCSLI